MSSFPGPYLATLLSLAINIPNGHDVDWRNPVQSIQCVPAHGSLMTSHRSGMQKLKQKFAHRARVSTDSRVINTSSPSESHPEASTQPSIEVTSSTANSEATGSGGRDVSNTEREPPWGLKLLYEGISPVVE